MDIKQPFSDSGYLVEAIFGLSCIVYVINVGVNSSKIVGYKKKAIYPIFQSVPGLVLFLYAIGRVESEAYTFDLALMLVSYAIVVTSIIWMNSIAEYAYCDTESYTREELSERQERIIGGIFSSVLITVLAALFTWAGLSI
ncbi:MAG: hypothetical protein GY694_03830 [Gammaproteobacteria bacterium]|nr:hypothetical protein [Gammaproteobacteria bacterium]